MKRPRNYAAVSTEDLEGGPRPKPRQREKINHNEPCCHWMIGLILTLFILASIGFTYYYVVESLKTHIVTQMTRSKEAISPILTNLTDLAHQHVGTVKVGMSGLRDSYHQFDAEEKLQDFSDKLALNADLATELLMAVWNKKQEGI